MTRRILAVALALLTACRGGYLDIMPNSILRRSEHVTVQCESGVVDCPDPYEVEAGLECVFGSLPLSVRVVYTGTQESAYAWYQAGYRPEFWAPSVVEYYQAITLGGPSVPAGYYTRRDAVIVLLPSARVEDRRALEVHEYLHVLLGGDPGHDHEAWETLGVCDEK